VLIKLHVHGILLAFVRYQHTSISKTVLPNLPGGT